MNHFLKLYLDKTSLDDDSVIFLFLVIKMKTDRLFPEGFVLEYSSAMCFLFVLLFFPKPFHMVHISDVPIVPRLLFTVVISSLMISKVLGCSSYSAVRPPCHCMKRAVLGARVLTYDGHNHGRPKMMASTTSL